MTPAQLELLATLAAYTSRGEPLRLYRRARRDAAGRLHDVAAYRVCYLGAEIARARATTVDALVAAGALVASPVRPGEAPYLMPTDGRG